MRSRVSVLGVILAGLCGFNSKTVAIHPGTPQALAGNTGSVLTGSTRLAVQIWQGCAEAAANGCGSGVGTLPGRKVVVMAQMPDHVVQTRLGEGSPESGRRYWQFQGNVAERQPFC